MTYDAGRMVWRSRHHTEPEAAYGEYLTDAQRLATRPDRGADAAGAAAVLPPDLESLRWFPLPGERA